MMSPSPPPNEPDVVHVRVNGEPREFPGGTTVADLVESLGLAGGPYAVERNRAIVPKSQHGQLSLAEGDALEIVGFVGGG